MRHSSSMSQTHTCFSHLCGIIIKKIVSPKHKLNVVLQTDHFTEASRRIDTSKNGVMIGSDNGMMTSWKKILVIGPLWGESTGHRWIPLTKASDAELSCFLWSTPEQTGWANNRDAGYLKKPSRSLWHHCSGWSPVRHPLINGDTLSTKRIGNIVCKIVVTLFIPQHFIHHIVMKSLHDTRPEAQTNTICSSWNTRVVSYFLPAKWLTIETLYRVPIVYRLSLAKGNFGDAFLAESDYVLNKLIFAEGVIPIITRCFLMA